MSSRFNSSRDEPWFEAATDMPQRRKRSETCSKQDCGPRFRYREEGDELKSSEFCIELPCLVSDRIGSHEQVIRTGREKGVEMFIDNRGWPGSRKRDIRRGSRKRKR